jgi:ATP-dependent helicase/nuclease subunit B
VLHVAHGPFHTALEDALVGRIQELKSADPLAPICVVAPSSRLANRVKELALRACPKGVAALHVHHLMSFARLAAGEGASVEDDFLLERLVADLVAREFPRSVYLNHAAGAPRLARSLLDLLLDLREGGVDPEVAYRALQEGELGDDDRLKLGEIFALQKAYESELLRRGWTDRADLVRKAAERAPESAELAGFKEILYYGVVELVQVQIDLLRAVSRRLPVRLYYPWVKRPEYAFAEEFFVQVVRPLADTHEALDPGPGPSPSVETLHASGPRDEVWACAKRILEWHDEGVPFDEIGVVARRIEPYSDSVEGVFKEHRIPFSSSAWRPLERDPYVSSAKALLTLADGDFSRDAVMDLLGSPYFRHDGPSDPVLWDALSRVLGIGRGAAEWRRRLPEKGGFLRKRGERGDERELAVPPEQVERFRRDVDRLLDRAVPPPAPTWEEYASWALGLIDEFLVPGPPAGLVREALERLAGLGRIAGTATGADRRDTALRLLADLRAPLGSGNIRGVQVIDAMAARGLPFRRLAVLGLNERVFPRFILEDPFVRDAVRSRIAARLGPRMPLKLKGYEEERFLFELLREAAGERLLLSYQRSDERGRAQVRSTFLSEEGTAVSRPPRRRLEFSPRPLLTRKEAGLVEALHGGPARVAAALKAFGGDAEGFRRRAEILREIDSARTPGRRDGVVGVSGRGRTISPTALEKFATCPFLYFADRVLRLKPLEEPEEERETSPLEEGELFHGFLQTLHGRLKGNLPRSLEEARPEFDRTLAESFARLESERSVRHPLVWEAEKAGIRRVLEAVVAFDLANLDGFVPARFEQAVVGEVEVGGIRLHAAGFIDRLDLRPDGAFRVIDYKRSRSKGKYGSRMETGVRKGRYYQPPLYFLLAERLLLGEGRKVDRAGSRSGYLFLRDLAEGRDGGMWLEGGLGGVEAEFAGHLGRAIESIDKGEFVVRPGDHCKYCDFRTACRKQHTPTRMRAERFHERRADGGD